MSHWRQCHWIKEEIPLAPLFKGGNMECIIRDDAYLSSDTVTVLQKGDLCLTCDNQIS